jgi:hypothetical protein
VALLAPGCAFVPQPNLRLDEALREYQSASAEPRISTLAPRELAVAREILDRAIAARNTLQDVAEVDHLAYLARQRVAISREAALQRSIGED